MLYLLDMHTCLLLAHVFAYVCIYARDWRWQRWLASLNLKRTGMKTYEDLDRIAVESLDFLALIELVLGSAALPTGACAWALFSSWRSDLPSSQLRVPPWTSF